MESLFQQRIEGIRSPRPADPKTVRLCFSEADAVKGSILISGLTLAEIGARIGVSKQAVGKWITNGVPEFRTTAFQNATGTLLLTQYRAMEQAEREAAGVVRESDRIARLASYSKAAA
jgi:hypothetical protein